MTRRRVSVDEIHPENMKCVTSPTVYHAAIVIFLEFFAFGLLTTPMISVLDETFPKHTFLMNGIIQGVKGFLSFLSAPLIGALSDGIGRKPFLLITVTFTCCPIPLMKISHWWYFTMISISGIFAVTFSVVLAYVADITTEEDRSWGYGLVSATFAASLVSSPAIGAYLGRIFSEELVVALATAIAFLDIFFILACVPESLTDKVRLSHSCASAIRGNTNGNINCGRRLSWDKIDPFAALRKVTNDYLVLIICITTFFSYLPEAGQYSCFIVYLRLVMGFSEESVALFIAVGGILACISQTVVLNILNLYVGPKRAIIIGLAFEAIQLTLYGFATHPALLWIAGLIAATGSITYPALSAFVSKHAAADQQGVAQGLVTGIRGLCGGLGPALFGLIFYIFRVDLNTQTAEASTVTKSGSSANKDDSSYLQLLDEQLIPGAPFAFGAVLVLLAIFVSWFIPENPKAIASNLPLSSNSSSGLTHGSTGSFPGNRLRYLSSDSVDRNSKQCIMECEPDGGNDHDDQAIILDSKFRPKHVRVPFKDRLISGSEPGFWDRWIFGWSDNRRRSQSWRTNRMFRQPTVSFTRARFVEPIRRLLNGFSTGKLGNSTIELQSSAVDPAQSTGLDLNTFEPFALTANRKPLYAQPWYDAEAADLSNYRSHNLKQLIVTASDQIPFPRQFGDGYFQHRTRDPVTNASSHNVDDRTRLLSSFVDADIEESLHDFPSHSRNDLHQPVTSS